MISPAPQRRSRLFGTAASRCAGVGHAHGPEAQRYLSADPIRGAAGQGGPHDRTASNGNRDGVRDLRPRPPERQCHAHLVPGRQRLRGRDAPGTPCRWDFEEENPLRDARGFDLARENADASQLTDEDIGLANVILTNGARLYVDHAHPEYSAPEVTNPWDAVLWDKAGERIMAEAAERAAQVPGAQPIHLYKNNTDNKGASYGTHENYLMKRRPPSRTSCGT